MVANTKIYLKNVSVDLSKYLAHISGRDFLGNFFLTICPKNRIKDNKLEVIIKAFVYGLTHKNPDYVVVMPKGVKKEIAVNIENIVYENEDSKSYPQSYDELQ